MRCEKAERLDVNRLPLLGLLIAAVLAAQSSSSPTLAAASDRDCADFGSQAEAQGFFESHGPGDPHQLDADGNGRACEALPCPCSPGGGGGGGGGNGTADPKSATVSGIADGDTIEVRLKRRTEDVRLIGIDTPEVYSGEECGGARASDSIRHMLDLGDRVSLIRDRSQDNRDRYGRLLRYVERSGSDIGRKQIRRGWAEVYVFETRFERVGSYRRVEGKARDAGRGVWSRCDGDFHSPL